MMHRIVSATAHPDYRIDIRWDCGARVEVDLKDFVATGEVTAPLRDPDYFVGKLIIGGDGDWIGWPGEVDIDVDALWYQAHPEDWRRDYGSPEAAAQ